jgi:fructokinase
MILVCGEALIDFFPTDGGTDLAFEGRLGGSPYNVAVGLARLGARSAFFGGLSRDVFGQRLSASLAAEGVDLTHAVYGDASSTVSFVVLSPDGVASYAFLGEGAADRMVGEADLPDLAAEVAAIHVGSFSTLVEPVGSTLAALVARESGRRLVSYDPNIRPTVIPDLDRWRARIAAWLPHVHLLKISEEDLALVHPGADPEAVAADWLAAGVRLVVLTRGAAGAVAWTRRCRVAVPGVPVDVVDTVGAGDTFQAALLAGLSEAGALARDAVGELDERALGKALSAAAAAAAITCARRGADLPRRAEVEAFG